METGWWRSRERRGTLCSGTDLAANAEFRDFGLVAFLLNRFLGHGAECLFIRILRRFAMTPNHFFSRHDPHEPIGFRLVPGNFHSVGTHSSPPCQPQWILLLEEAGELYFSRAEPARSRRYKTAR